MVLDRGNRMSWTRVRYISIHPKEVSTILSYMMTKMNPAQPLCAYKKLKTFHKYSRAINLHIQQLIIRPEVSLTEDDACQSTS